MVTVLEPTKTAFVSSGMTAWQQISEFAGEPIKHSTPRAGRFYNDRINPFYKTGYRLATGEILVIQHNRMSGDMRLSLFSNLEAQRAYEEEGDKLVANPETGRRSALYES